MSHSRSTSKQILGLAAWLVVSFAAAAVGAWASVNAPEFYRELDRPFWAPPASVFGPVWTVLYTLQGVAAWLVWRECGFQNAPTALGLFLLQLALNALWSWLFFVWHRGAMAFAEVLALEAMIVATTFAFWRVQKLSALLLIPYLTWVGFASFLTFAVWQRNHGLLGE
jgi:benzodiazapine receptor